MWNQNTIIVDSERDMKSFYSSIKHPSQLFNKYFIDTLSPLFPKIILGKDPLKLAQEHLFLHHQHIVEPRFNDRFAQDTSIMDACSEAEEIKAANKKHEYEPILLDNYMNTDKYLKFVFAV